MWEIITQDFHLFVAQKTDIEVIFISGILMLIIVYARCKYWLKFLKAEPRYRNRKVLDKYWKPKIMHIIC